MEILLFIFKPNILSLKSHDLSDGKYVSNPNNTILLMIHYRHGENSIFRRCLTHEEVEKVLNDCHSRACGIHMSRYAIAQKILHASYF